MKLYKVFGLKFGGPDAVTRSRFTFGDKPKVKFPKTIYIYTDEKDMIPIVIEQNIGYDVLKWKADEIDSPLFQHQFETSN